VAEREATGCLLADLLRSNPLEMARDRQQQGDNPKLLKTRCCTAQPSGGLAERLENVIKTIDCHNILLKARANIQRNC